MKTTRFYREQKVLEMLSISSSTWRRWQINGVAPVPFKPGGPNSRIKVYSAEEIDAFMNNREKS